GAPLPRPAPALPSKLAARPGAAPPGPAGASAAFATKPAPKTGGFGAPPARSGLAPQTSPKAPAPQAPAPAPTSSSAKRNGAAESTDDIEIDVDDGGASPNDSAIEIGDDGLADAEAALEAMQSFRLAEAALQRNDVANAQKLAQKAVDGDPTQSDYVTLLAWIRSLGNDPAALEEAISTMTRVLGEEPSSERALLYRGKLLARANRNAEALADLNELLASNPHHRDAQAEIRQLKSKMG
ncbi:MAG: Translation initiation factor 2, partial [Labilithrix sp.]|nr:Translation initiation factor 2 [Labilithrix sp.]